MPHTHHCCSFDSILVFDLHLDGVLFIPFLGLHIYCRAFAAFPPFWSLVFAFDFFKLGALQASLLGFCTTIWHSTGAAVIPFAFAGFTFASLFLVGIGNRLFGVLLFSFSVGLFPLCFLGIFWRASSITSCSWCIWMMGICWLERLAGLILWSLSALLDIFLSFSLILGSCLSFFLVEIREFDWYLHTFCSCYLS